MSVFDDCFGKLPDGRVIDFSAWAEGRRGVKVWDPSKKAWGDFPCKVGTVIDSKPIDRAEVERLTGLKLASA